MKKIGVIGLGYVGFPMLVAAASRKTNKGYLFNVTGFEKNNKQGLAIKDLINSNKLPILSNDKNLKKQFNIIHKKKLFKIKNNFEDIALMDVIIISINFDYKKKQTFSNLKNLINQVSKKVKKGSLIIIESTLIPGTCDNICVPIIKKRLSDRGMSLNDIYFGYSYERVTPGENYLKSILTTSRNYAGYNENSANKINLFFNKFFGKEKLNHFRFKKLIECETAKIIENSYRSLNIAFIHEWMEFSKTQHLDLQRILKSIRLRHTHSNIMNPGLGVGGYCLTKDPKFSYESSKKFLGGKIKFPLSVSSVKINRKLITFSSKFIKSKMKNIKKKKILFCGYAYKEDVGDFRNSPTSLLIKDLKIEKFDILDPYINNGLTINSIKPKFYDLIIFTVNHKQFTRFPYTKLSKNNVIFDLNDVVQRKDIKNRKNYYSISNFSK